jgi:3-deoxy-manno-octulosonate cytidylyltransferase (CMP-KDO synthetase)
MEIVAVIPARFASTRLPGKALLSETGRPLIVHVIEAARRAKSLQRIIVATDDARIAQAVTSFGGEVMMTRADHPTGTDRVAEGAARLDHARVRVKLQG